MLFKEFPMQNIGARIRTWREDRNISREELAEQAGLAVPFLAALEDEGLLPALGPLHKVARALGVRLGTFMDDQVTRDPVITRASGHNGDLAIGRAREADPALRYTALARGKSDRNMEPFFMEVEPDAAEQTSSHQGEEFLYVLEGAVRLEYGRVVHTLRAGDSIYYNSIVPHAVRAEGGPARLLAVVYFPV